MSTVKTEPCAVGALRLSLDAQGRLVKAELFDGEKRLGPTLALDPDRQSGTYYKDGDSHQFSYGGGRSCMHTAWDDEGQEGYAEAYDAWVERCLEDLRSLGLGLLWKAADDDLKAGRFDESAKAYATLLERWGAKSTVWLDPGDERNQLNRTTLAFLEAVSASRGKDPGIGATWGAWCRGDREVKEVVHLLDLAGKALGAQGVAALKAVWVKVALARAVESAGRDDTKLQAGLDRLFRLLKKMEGGRQAFADTLVEMAGRTPRLASWASFYGVKAGGTTSERTRRLLEKKARGGKAEVADLNNLALHHINAGRRGEARATLDRVEAILKGRPPLDLGPGLKKGDFETLKRLEDEYFYSVHRASLLWQERRFDAAWPVARRALDLENANREVASFEDPFDGSIRFGVARSGGSWAYLSVLTGLKRFKDVDDAFRKILDDKPVMEARVRLDPTGLQYLLVAGLSSYLDAQAKEVLDWSPGPYKAAKKIVPEPTVSNLTYTYACLEARYGHNAAALGFLKKSLERGFSKTHARNDPDLQGLAKNPKFLAMVR
jgi:tetratricopeptide (TPR) repeat protein